MIVYIDPRFRWAVCQIDSLQQLKSERKIIQKALKNLPKTLDETYDRILFAVPKDERLFVDYALQWIAYHTEMYNGQGIPYEVLIEAIEAGILRLTGIQNERFYDKDTLREVCGCLINIAPEDCLNTLGEPHHTYISVTFAHYSVREYLDSSRTLNTVFGHRTIGGGNLKDQLLEITLSEAQRIEPDELWELGSKFPNNPDVVRVVRAVDSRFNIYCVVSALVSLYLSSDRICQENTLKALAIDLLDPSMPHFSTMRKAVSVIELATPVFSEFLGKSCFWAMEWHPDTKTELIHLYNLLLLTESDRECLPLAKTFLQERDSKSLLQAQVCFSREMWSIRSYEDHKTSTFKGTFVEIFAQLALRSVGAFKLLMEVGAGFYDPSVALLLFIRGHDHSLQWDCKGFCPLQRLLEAGADPNLRGYRITPLQIATVSSDCDGVERLLKAGALPNDTGSPNGVIWEEDSSMRILNHLHGASPLKICRDFEHFYRRIDQIEGKTSDRQKIEELLLQYGAEAFSTTCGASQAGD